MSGWNKLACHSVHYCTLPLIHCCCYLHKCVRHKQLESILVVTQQFHETLEPLSEWLAATEKHLANSEPTGTETSKLEDQICQHKVISIISHHFHMFLEVFITQSVMFSWIQFHSFCLFLSVYAFHYFPFRFSFNFSFIFLFSVRVFCLCHTSLVCFPSPVVRP